MKSLANLPIFVAVGLTATALLSGCSATTYGTGVDPGTQTVRDIVGVVRMTPTQEEEKIDYKPRAGIVEPPSNALPTPGAATQTAANWPTDPEAQRLQLEARADAARADGQLYDPGVRIIGETRTVEEETEGFQGGRNLIRANAATSGPRPNTTPRAGSVDAAGVPTRKFLVEPPTEYRQPDPTAPQGVTTEKPKQGGGGFLSRLWPF